ncbi:response regulator transcription factor [Gracilibacillus xinjiangensis]|uniref:Response regulator n=1 Tax=Gracilibacillus xinjiangensis TaxID=1193282 RepID=A0ABV8WYC9_9BACI
MIKVLLVEDDKLVRKSLIASFNWKRFNMEVVGEAKNGEKAAEFLEKYNVDLLITDLAMPIMSGIELIRLVKDRYPGIFIVVLSLHRDFEYIQEAMRLGAIDYIAKVELDSDNMDQTLDRIKKRINEEVNKTQQPLIQNVSNGLIVIFEKLTDDNRKLLTTVLKEGEIIFLTSDVILIPLASDIEKKQSLQEMAAISGWDGALLIIEIENQSYTFKQLQQLVQQFKDSILFYETSPQKPFNSRKMEHMEMTVTDLQDGEVKNMKETLLSLKWIYSQKMLDDILYELKQMKLTKNKLNEILMMTVNECHRIFAEMLPVNLFLPETFKYWYEVEEWLTETKTNIYQTIHKKNISNETSKSILKSIHLIEKQLGENITATEISKQINMSRSYFCICFKQVTGVTFHEYVKVSRINKAKHYLENTLEKVSIVAEKVGYKDVKYFSKLFKQETGILPSEYRKKHKKE